MSWRQLLSNSSWKNIWITRLRKYLEEKTPLSFTLEDPCRSFYSPNWSAYCRKCNHFVSVTSRNCQSDLNNARSAAHFKNVVVWITNGNVFWLKKKTDEKLTQIMSCLKLSLTCLCTPCSQWYENKLCNGILGVIHLGRQHENNDNENLISGTLNFKTTYSKKGIYNFG